MNAREKGLLWKYRVRIDVESVGGPPREQAMVIEGTIRASLGKELAGDKAVRRSLHDACNRIGKRR